MLTTCMAGGSDSAGGKGWADGIGGGSGSGIDSQKSSYFFEYNK